MATILYAWELGGGMGHIMPFRPVAEELIKKGHRVVAALRELTHAQQAFGDLPVQWLPAPTKSWPTTDRIDPLLSYAHILNNVGWSRISDLQTMVKAWRTIFEFVQPNLVVCDHSPTALLALRGSPIKRVVIGEGFGCPPDVTPLPQLRPLQNASLAKVADDEQAVLKIANEVLAANQQPPLERLGQLFSQFDECLLTTFAELDHFPQRRGGQYFGILPFKSTTPIQWPTGSGPKHFVYLHRFPDRPAVLEQLCRSPLSIAIISSDFSPAEMQICATPNVKLLPALVNLQQAAAECDMAVLGAGHGTTTQILLAGKPVLLLPLTAGQKLLADRVEALGAGRICPPNRPLDFVPTLRDMLAIGRYSNAAQCFSAKYAAFNSNRALTNVVVRLMRILNDPTDDLVAN